MAEPYNLETSIAASKFVAVAAGRSAEWAEYVVTSDLFAGDFGDGSERTLVDHLTTAKRGGPCRECAGTEHAAPIVKGEIVRVIKMVDSEGFYGGRVCVRCLDRDYAENYDEPCDIIWVVKEEDGSWTVGCCEEHDPHARVWDTAEDARAELGANLDWWEEEPGVWMAHLPLSADGREVTP